MKIIRTMEDACAGLRAAHATTGREHVAIRLSANRFLVLPGVTVAEIGVQLATARAKKRLTTPSGSDSEES